jgi:hypothetical protein
MEKENVEKNPQTLANKLPKVHPELNLEKWSIWRPSKSPGKDLKRQEFEREASLPDGSKLNSKVQIGFTDRGVLTTEDRKLYYALIKIWEDKGRPCGQIAISLRRLAKELHKRWGTNVNDSLTQSLLRLRFTPFTWENSYFNAETKQTEHLLTAFTILADLKISRKSLDGHKTKEAGFFRFNDHILNNLLNNYTKPLYLATLLKFKNEIAQLIYAHVDLIMADKTYYVRRSELLFQDLGLNAKTYRKPSVRREKLEKAMKELQGVPLTTGVLKQVSIEHTKDTKDYKVIFIKQQGADQNGAPIKKPTIDPRAKELVNTFHRRLSRPDHNPSQRELQQATSLLAQYDQDQVTFIIEYALREAPKTNFRMKTFGAILQYQEEAINAYGRQHHQQELFETEHLDLERQAQEMVDQEHSDLETWYAALSDAEQKKVDQRIKQKIKRMKLSEEDELYGALTAQARYQVLAEEQPHISPGD